MDRARVQQIDLISSSTISIDTDTTSDEVQCVKQLDALEFEEELNMQLPPEAWAPRHAHHPATAELPPPPPPPCDQVGAQAGAANTVLNRNGPLPLQFRQSGKTTMAVMPAGPKGNSYLNESDSGEDMPARRIPSDANAASADMLRRTPINFKLQTQRSGQAGPVHRRSYARWDDPKVHTTYQVGPAAPGSSVSRSVHKPYRGRLSWHRGNAHKPTPQAQLPPAGPSKPPAHQRAVSLTGWNGEGGTLAASPGHEPRTPPSQVPTTSTADDSDQGSPKDTPSGLSQGNQGPRSQSGKAFEFGTALQCQIATGKTNVPGNKALLSPPPPPTSPPPPPPPPPPPSLPATDNAFAPLQGSLVNATPPSLSNANADNTPDPAAPEHLPEITCTNPVVEGTAAEQHEPGQQVQNEASGVSQPGHTAGDPSEQVMVPLTKLAAVNPFDSTALAHPTVSNLTSDSNGAKRNPVRGDGLKPPRYVAGAKSCMDASFTLGEGCMGPPARPRARPARSECPNMGNGARSRVTVCLPAETPATRQTSLLQSMMPVNSFKPFNRLAGVMSEVPHHSPAEVPAGNGSVMSPGPCISSMSCAVSRRPAVARQRQLATRSLLLGAQAHSLMPALEQEEDDFEVQVDDVTIMQGQQEYRVTATQPDADADLDDGVDSVEDARQGPSSAGTGAAVVAPMNEAGGGSCREAAIASSGRASGFNSALQLLTGLALLPAAPVMMVAGVLAGMATCLTRQSAEEDIAGLNDVEPVHHQQATPALTTPAGNPPLSCTHVVLGTQSAGTSRRNCSQLRASMSHSTQPGRSIGSRGTHIQNTTQPAVVEGQNVAAVVDNTEPFPAASAQTVSHSKQSQSLTAATHATGSQANKAGSKRPAQSTVSSLEAETRADSAIPPQGERPAQVSASAPPMGGLFTWLTSPLMHLFGSVKRQRTDDAAHAPAASLSIPPPSLDAAPGGQHDALDAAECQLVVYAPQASDRPVDFEADQNQQEEPALPNQHDGLEEQEPGNNQQEPGTTVERSLRTEAQAGAEEAMQDLSCSSSTSQDTHSSRSHSGSSGRLFIKQEPGLESCIVKQEHQDSWIDNNSEPILQLDAVPGQAAMPSASPISAPDAGKQGTRTASFLGSMQTQQPAPVESMPVGSQQRDSMRVGSQQRGSMRVGSVRGAQEELGITNGGVRNRYKSKWRGRAIKVAVVAAAAFLAWDTWPSDME